MRALGTCLVTTLRLYRATWGRLFAGRCRFHPTCSQYWIDAIARHGACRGVARGVRRLSRCHPWGPVGRDEA
ncbi:MAG: membrane protein insertion efficiency factor YidD [Planctomycetes bacterium]|nr:membrane protein insertion efficiency factor YidD [Planctomycetota bacterium]